MNLSDLTPDGLKEMIAQATALKDWARKFPKHPETPVLPDSTINDPMVFWQKIYTYLQSSEGRVNFPSELWPDLANIAESRVAAIVARKLTDDNHNDKYDAMMAQAAQSYGVAQGIGHSHSPLMSPRNPLKLGGV